MIQDDVFTACHRDRVLGFSPEIAQSRADETDDDVVRRELQGVITQGDPVARGRLTRKGEVGAVEHQRRFERDGSRESKDDRAWSTAESMPSRNEPAPESSRLVT